MLLQPIPSKVFALWKSRIIDLCQIRTDSKVLRACFLTAFRYDMRVILAHIICDICKSGIILNLIAKVDLWG